MSYNPKWSKGPWNVSWANGNQVCLGSEGNRLEVPISLNYSNGACGQNHNARLISSAPDLHEAVFSIERALLDGFSALEILDENSPVREAITAALKKSGVSP